MATVRDKEKKGHRVTSRTNQPQAQGKRAQREDALGGKEHPVKGIRAELSLEEVNRREERSKNELQP